MKKSEWLFTIAPQSKFVTDGPEHSDEESWAILKHLETLEEKRITIPLSLPHGALKFCNNHKILILDGDGPGGAVLNTETLKIEKQFRAPEGFVFGGHGVFSADERLAYLTVWKTRDWDTGYISVFDTQNWVELSKIYTSMPHPHDLCWRMTDEELMVAHYGSQLKMETYNIKGGIVLFDLKNKRETFQFNSDYHNLRHCHIVADGAGGYFVGTSLMIEKEGKENDHLREVQMDWQLLKKVGSNQARSTTWHPSPLVKINPDLSAEELNLVEKEKLISSINICANPQNKTFAAAHSFSNSLSFWRGKELIKHVGRVGYPIGLTLTDDASEFVYFSMTGLVYFFDALTGKRNRYIRWDTIQNRKGVHAYLI